MSDSLISHGLQRDRLPCPSLFYRVCSNLPIEVVEAILSFVTLVSCPQSFPASGSFLMSQPFTSGGQQWSFSFSISPSNEYFGLISFRIEWFDLFEVQGTLKSRLQHHSSKASVLQHSASFMVRLSHPHITTGKIIAFWMGLCWQSDVSAF